MQALYIKYLCVCICKQKVLSRCCEVFPKYSVSSSHKDKPFNYILQNSVLLHACGGGGGGGGVGKERLSPLYVKSFQNIKICSIHKSF